MMNDEFGKKKTKRSNDDVPNPDGGNGIDSAVTKNSDQIEKATRKRKDKNEDDVEEESEYDHENDGPTAPKKPRFLWSKDLHHKFLVAVNQFGVDKAKPKKILNLMNAENLTKEHVASHLQKYRKKLKSISFGENQKANMVANLVSGSLTPGNVNIHGLANSTNDQLTFQPAIACAKPNHVQRMPISYAASQHIQFSFSLHEKMCNDIWSSMQLPETNSYIRQGDVFNSTSNVTFQGWNNNHNNHDRNYNSSHLIGSSIGSSMIPVVNLEPEGNLDHKDDHIVELTEGLPSKQEQLYANNSGGKSKSQQDNFFSKMKKYLNFL